MSCSKHQKTLKAFRVLLINFKLLISNSFNVIVFSYYSTNFSTIHVSESHNVGSREIIISRCGCVQGQGCGSFVQNQNGVLSNCIGIYSCLNSSTTCNIVFKFNQEETFSKREASTGKIQKMRNELIFILFIFCFLIRSLVDLVVLVNQLQSSP